jgi:hypothetical protein
MDGQLTVLALTFVINLVGSLAYSVRIVLLWWRSAG